MRSRLICDHMHVPKVDSFNVGILPIQLFDIKLFEFIEDSKAIARNRKINEKHMPLMMTLIEQFNCLRFTEYLKI